MQHSHHLSGFLWFLFLCNNLSDFFLKLFIEFLDFMIIIKLSWDERAKMLYLSCCNNSVHSASFIIDFTEQKNELGKDN